jgi:DNA polymerase III subunit epsilon
LLAQVYVELTGGRQIGLELSGSDGGDDLVSTVVTITRTREFRPPRPHAASADELAAHAAFMETVKTPVWYG